MKVGVSCLTGVVPRKPREIAGGVHHVWARGNNKALLFHDDVDREGYLWLLGSVVVRHRWRCLSYCLMDNHMHLLVETPEPNLGTGCSGSMGTSGAASTGDMLGSGHVFQGRFGSKPVRVGRAAVDGRRLHRREPGRGGAVPIAGGVALEQPRLRGGPQAAPAWLDLERLYERFEVWGGDPRARYLEAVAQRALAAARPVSRP